MCFIWSLLFFSAFEIDCIFKTNILDKERQINVCFFKKPLPSPNSAVFLADTRVKVGRIGDNVNEGHK